MSYREFMTIQRGTMDKTLVCVYPWEKPIVEEIHGGNAQSISINAMCDLQGPIKVENIKLVHGGGPGLTSRQQYEAMCRVEPDEDPVKSPESEWNRLCEKYGMHHTIAMPVAEKVFGSFAGFRRVVLGFRGPKPPKNINELLPGVEFGSGSDDAEETPIAEMTREELMAKLDAEAIAYPKNAGIEKLRDLVEMTVA